MPEIRVCSALVSGTRHRRGKSTAANDAIHLMEGVVSISSESDSDDMETSHRKRRLNKKGRQTRREPRVSEDSFIASEDEESDSDDSATNEAMRMLGLDTSVGSQDRPTVDDGMEEALGLLTDEVEN